MAAGDRHELQFKDGRAPNYWDSIRSYHDGQRGDQFRGVYNANHWKLPGFLSLTISQVFDRFPNYDLEGLSSTASRQMDSEILVLNPDYTFSTNTDPQLQTPCSEADKPCTRSILNALQLLCVPPSACLSFSDDSLSLPSGCSTYRPSRKMDDVLTTNRSVVDLVERVLRCSCSTTPSVQLLIVTVCDRLVAWYQAMLCDGKQQHSQEQNSLSLQTAEEELSEHVLVQPITMGDFAVDLEMQLHIREQLVIGELRRVEEITRLFAARVQKAKNQSSPGQGQKIYETLSLLLRHQLQVQAMISRGRLDAS